MGRSLVDLNLVVKEFLESRWDKQSPLLIAYSGGPDSEALLHTVKSWGKAPIHLAHVDHGWREESRQEALLLGEEARRLGVLFHTVRIEKCSEEEARKSRLQFFSSLQEKVPFQAVLLGHQANDLAETALKRLFEGAHLTRLFGMQAEVRLEGLLLWRPLLQVPRSVIEAYLAERSLNFLTDPTNRDPRYLRSRMRVSLLPQLEETFGKGVFENLLLLAARSQELDRYLAKQVKEMAIHRGPLGIWIEGNEQERIELRYLLQQAALEEHLMLSRDVIETLLDWALEKQSNKEIRVGGRRIVAHRGHLFLLAKQLPRFHEPIAIEPSGCVRSGDWKVCVVTDSGSTGWRALWQEGATTSSVAAIEGLQLALPASGMRWSDSAPAFLRKLCPVLLGSNGPVGNFLSPRPPGIGKIVKIFIDPKSF